MTATVHVYADAFSWLADSQAPEDFRKLLAVAFSAVLREETQRNVIEPGVPGPDRKPAIVAGDGDFLDWVIEVPMESLISGYLRKCVEMEEADFLAFDLLAEAADMLERLGREARTLQARYKPGPPAEDD